jgi:Ca2+:H+ antiporter
MNPLLKEIRRNPLLWLLAFVPAVLAAQKLKPEAHTLLFALSVLAIVPLAGLLSHATESVAAKTGDAVGGVLNATLGNLTELVIALAALQAGQYMLVKASIAGAIVTNTLFVLGASFLLGGLKHHVQEYNRVSARMQAGLLFLATIALLIPSAVSQADAAAGAAFTQKLSVGLAVLLIVAYGLGMLFSLKTHRELFSPFVSEARRLYQISFRLSVPCPSKSPPWSMVTGGNSGGELYSLPSRCNSRMRS